MEIDDDTIIEETELDILGVIPVHLKDFENISIYSVSNGEVFIKVDDTELKGKVNDIIGTTMFFNLNNELNEIELVSCTEKQINFEPFFSIPLEEFEKPFIPSEAISKKK